MSNFLHNIKDSNIVLWIGQGEGYVKMERE